MADRLLIKGGTVLSLDRAVGNMVDADVLIEDGIIAEVGTSLRARGAEVVDAADTIVMPGFVDAHRRLWQSLAGDAGARPAPTGRATTHPTTSTPRRSPDCSSAIEAGITTVVDWCDISGDAAHLEAALRAHADSGVRTVFVPPGSSWATPVAGTTVACGSPDVVEGELDALGAAMGAGPRSGSTDPCPGRHCGSGGRRGGRAGPPRTARVPTSRCATAPA